ncbi:MAG: hypothetical protein COT90_01170 [Candidatus Diapherotrites archaeon CG10_big_fil_rev_8_21_14_0_10_31_34]|nr:MAG: hypothetical protein COT90_01170 [Candidatus Diapherotrites archaeon CG10_big_fil_rev_8_21_14_0_10_31_34]
MNKVQLSGIALFSSGLLLVLGYFIYKFFLEATEVPETIKLALLLIFLGLIVSLASLSFKRIKELKK